MAGNSLEAFATVGRVAAPVPTWMLRSWHGVLVGLGLMGSSGGWLVWLIGSDMGGMASVGRDWGCRVVLRVQGELSEIVD